MQMHKEAAPTSSHQHIEEFLPAQWEENNAKAKKRDKTGLAAQCS